MTTDPLSTEQSPANGGRSRSKSELVEGFSAAELAQLRAAFDTAIPEDEWAGGWDGGVRRLLAEHGSTFMNWAVGPLRRATALLTATAEARFKKTFLELGAREREVVFAHVLASDDSEAGGTGSLASLVTVAYQGYYGNTSEPAGWAMVGFSPLPDGVIGLDPDPLPAIDPGALRDSYDVVIVGAGAGGGAMAAELAGTGRRVLLLERARAHRDTELRGNHLQGKRAALYDVTAGAGKGSPRVLEAADGSTTLLPGDGSGEAYGLNAMTAGGGTRLWQGMAWRFFKEDFAMASTYGVPEDSTLADWPFGYDELAPYYDRAEWELGVSGNAASPITKRTPRTRGYPMPALPDDQTRVAYTAAAARLGIEAGPIPFAINSVPRNGRAACVRCAQCVGHSCPVNAKNGTHNTFIPRAIATGNCDLLFSAQATRIEHNHRGTAKGVRVVIRTAHGPIERMIRANTIVVSAGAIETPRLLLASGIGNEWVGLNHHSHGVAMAFALQSPPIKEFKGPGHSVASLDWVHRDGEAWGGGVMFDMPPAYPVMKAEMGRKYAGKQFGLAHKKWMRDTPPFVGAMSMVQEIPDAASRVSIDSAVSDEYGMPVARLRGRGNPASQEAADYMVSRCTDWVEEVGGREIVRVALPGFPVGTEHSAGTVRLGSDPAASACDPHGRLYGMRNVYIADASLHPTNGGFNPGLTIVANSLRIASLMQE